MNVVITGATSFIGRSIIKQLILEKQAMIWAIVRPNSLNLHLVPKDNRIHIIELDMCDIEELPKFLVKPIDVFYHLAWEGVRVPARDNKELQYKNYQYSMKAINVCHRLGCKRFIVSGSQAEYGMMQGNIDETYPCNPNTEYGKAKYRTYCDAIKYAKENGIQLIWTRIFSIYGVGDYQGSLVMTCIKKMRKNESIALTECIQKWDYLYIDDAARLFVLFAKNEVKCGIYNVASGKSRQLRNYIEEIKQEMKSDSILEYGNVPYPESGMVSFVPVVDKICQELQWQPKISFREGIKKIIQEQSEENEKN